MGIFIKSIIYYWVLKMYAYKIFIFLLKSSATVFKEQLHAYNFLKNVIILRYFKAVQYWNKNHDTWIVLCILPKTVKAV